MERVNRWKEKILGSCGYHSNHSHSRLGYWLVVIAGCACTVGCTTLKKAAIVSSLGTTGALVGNAVSGTAGLVVGGLTTAAVTDVATEVMIGRTGKATMNDCAPDNFWSLLGSLVEMGMSGCLSMKRTLKRNGWKDTASGKTRFTCEKRTVELKTNNEGNNVVAKVLD